MSTLNLNANINGAKRGLPYPTAGLDVIVYNSTYEDGGTTYYRTSKGIGLPVISGTGLDTIIDFSVLLVGGKKDLRFNKNAYVGSSYTDDEGNPLPANYNFPFVGIYYDSANPYYWKITDFAYAVILAQSLLVDNMFFLKATATTNTSNVIATWDKLFIYTTALADNNLTKIKNYIGIQPDFYGDELLETLNFNDWSAFTQVTIDANNIFTSSANGYGVILDNAFVCCKKYQIVVKGNTTSFGGIKLVNNSGGTTPLIYEFTTSGSFDISVDFTVKFTYLYIRNTNSGTTTVTEISIKEIYQNYYKS